MRDKNESVKKNPAAENNRAPRPMPKDELTSGRRAPSKGDPKPIPSTMGYVGKRIK